MVFSFKDQEPKDDQDYCDSNVNRDALTTSVEAVAAASATKTPVNQVHASKADKKMKGSDTR